MNASNKVKPVTMLGAINMALHRLLGESDRYLVLGEDVARNGGVFRATDGLLEQFGPRRVLDTPLAETMIAGVSVGMAAQGLRPIAEIQFMGFIYATMEQMVSHAARLRHRTRGRLNCPMVLRAPFGGGIHAPEHHSESTEALFAHIPGLRVVMPSSPARAYGLLLAAARCNDPVVFLEPKRLYRVSQSLVNDNGNALPLDSSFVLRRGEHLSMICWGACVHETMQAADKLSQQGIECSVIDCASLSPIDYRPMIASIKESGRALIVHEAAKHAGLGGEIAASLHELAAPYLQRPIARVTGYDTVMPYFKNEAHYLPSVARIVSQAKALLSVSQEVPHAVI